MASVGSASVLVRAKSRLPSPSLKEPAASVKAKYVGWLRFNKHGRYFGPWPPRCGHTRRSLTARNGVQRSQALAAYNSRICQ